MVIYLINVLGILFWGLIFGIGKPNKIKTILLLFFCFLQLLGLSYFRSDIGYDYQMYAEGFFNMSIDAFSNFEYLDWEIGFVVFTKAISLLTHNPDIYFLIISAFCLSIAMVFIGLNSKIPWLSVLLYVNFYFFYMSMNFLRQTMAISFILIGWEFMKRKKFWVFLIFLIIAATFHKTALIMLPIYFFVKIYPSKKLILFYGYGLLIFYISSNGIIELLTSFFYSDYKNSIFLTGLPIVYSILPATILAVAILFRNRLIENDERNRYYIHFAYITVFLMLLMSRHAVFERLSYYTFIFIILLVPEIVYDIRQKFINSDDFKPQGERFSNYNQTKRVKTSWIRLITSEIVIVATVFYNFLGIYDNAHGVVPYTYRDISIPIVNINIQSNEKSNNINYIFDDTLNDDNFDDFIDDIELNDIEIEDELFDEII